MKEKFSDRLNWGLFSKHRTSLYGAATLLIMIFHAQNIVPYIKYVTPITNYFNCGVEMFLLLSGICLYFSYSNCPKYDVFMKKRLSRTLVPYFSFAVIYFAWRYLFAELSVLDFLYNASGLSLILVKAENYLVLGKSFIWFVAFIIFMYALYPLIYKAMFTPPVSTNVRENRGRRNFIFMLVFAFAISIFIKFYAPDTYATAETWTTRLPIFIIGCYAGKAVKEKRKFKIFDYFLFFVAIPVKIIMTIFNLDELVYKRYFGIFLSLMFCFLIVFVLELINIKPLTKVLAFFGNMSLEVYMTHVMLYRVVLYYFPDMRASDDFTFKQKVLIYALILVAATIISFAYTKILQMIKERKKLQKAK